MKPYSIDLRQKIVEVYEKEDTSIRKVAERFKVAKSFVQKILKQYRETGDLSPKVQGGSPPRKLQGEHLISLIEIIESNNDATLEELCDLLHQKTNIQVSRSTMGRITIELNYSVKKKLFTQPKKQVREYRKRDLSTGKKSKILWQKT